MTRRSERAGRHGYTLIEMIIASVLTGTLMALVYGLMSMYNSQLTAGQSRTLEQQLIRSVFQLLEDDLQSVQVPAETADLQPMSSVPQFSTLASAENSIDSAFSMNITNVVPSSDSELSLPDPADDSLSFISELSSANDPKPPLSISLVGNTQSLRLSFERPVMNWSRRPAAGEADDGTAESLTPGFSPPSSEAGLNAATGNTTSEYSSMPQDGTAPFVEDFRTIVWQFQSPGMLTPGTQQMNPGLYRIQTDSLSLQFAMMQQQSLPESANTDSSDAPLQSGSMISPALDHTTLETLWYSRTDVDDARSSASSPADRSGPVVDRIPEVVGFRIEYFNGTVWESSWNSDLRNSLPVAIRVRLRLVSSANLERLNQQLSVSDSPDSSMNQALNAGMQNQPTSESPVGDSNQQNPYPAIPVKDVERIILLRPIIGPVPVPGTDVLTDDTPSFGVLGTPSSFRSASVSVVTT